MASPDELEEATISSCVRGYHVYKDIWSSSPGQKFTCNREFGYARDRYAVAVVRNAETIGHIPKRISQVCSIFIRQGGSICCTITGNRKYSSDLPKGGLEVPCTLHFKGRTKEMKKLKLVLKLFDYDIS